MSSENVSGLNKYIGNSNEKEYHNVIVGNLTTSIFEKILDLNNISKINVKNVNIANIITNIENIITNIDNSDLPIFTIESGYNNLENIFVNENNLYYSDISGILYNKKKNNLIRYPPSSKTDYKDILTYNSSIFSIDNYAFKGITKIKNIIFSSSINNIGSNSFSNNPNLYSIGFFYNTDFLSLEFKNDCFRDICDNVLVFREFKEISNNFLDNYNNSTNCNYINIDEYFVDILDVEEIYLEGIGHLNSENVTYNSFLQDSGHNFGIIFTDDTARNKFLKGLEMSNNDFVSNTDVSISIKYLNKNQYLSNRDINLSDISNLTELNNQPLTGGKNYVLIRYVRGIFIHTSPFIYSINIEDYIISSTLSTSEYDHAILILYDGINTIYRDISINQTDISIEEVSANTFYVMTLIYYEYRNYSNLYFSYKNAFESSHKLDVYEINDNTFEGNLDIHNVIFNNNLTSIGSNAFNNCINLFSITFEKYTDFTTLQIGEGAFDNIKDNFNLNYYYQDMSVNDMRNFFQQYTNRSFKINLINDPSYTYYKLTDGNYVGNYSGGTTLNRVSNNFYTSFHSVISNYDATGVIEIIDVKSIDTIYIGENHTYIGNNCFSVNDSYTTKTINIDSNVISIGIGAFSANKIRNVIFTDIQNSQLTVIMPFAFWFTALNGFIFPSSLKIIGKNSFQGANKESFNTYTFYDIQHSQLETIESYAFQYLFNNLDDDVYIQIPPNVNNIQEYAFADNYEYNKQIYFWGLPPRLGVYSSASLEGHVSSNVFTQFLSSTVIVYLSEYSSSWSKISSIDGILVREWSASLDTDFSYNS